MTSETSPQGLLALIVVKGCHVLRDMKIFCATQINSICTYSKVALLLFLHLRLHCNFLIRRVESGILINKKVLDDMTTLNRN